MKKEISSSVREAGIYSVQNDSTQDISTQDSTQDIQHKIASTDKCSVILRFVKNNVQERLLAVVASHSATEVDPCVLIKGVLANQNIDMLKCISDIIRVTLNMSGLYEFLEKRLHFKKASQLFWKKISRSYSHMVLCLLCQFGAL